MLTGARATPLTEARNLLPLLKSHSADEIRALIAPDTETSDRDRLYRQRVLAAFDFLLEGRNANARSR